MTQSSIDQKEKEIRAGWKDGSVVEVYSASASKWYKGEIKRIFTDAEGEWLEVLYWTRQKQIPRDSKELHISEILRNELKVGSKCKIYSKEKNKIFPGKVVRIFTDNEGEWLEV
eukprot:424660_1